MYEAVPAQVLFAQVKYIILLPFTCLKKTFCVKNILFKHVYEYYSLINEFVFSINPSSTRVILMHTPPPLPGYRCVNVLQYLLLYALYNFILIEKDLSVSFVVYFAIQEFDVLRCLFSLRPTFFPLNIDMHKSFTDVI